MNTKGAIAAIKAFKEAIKGNTVDELEVRRRAKICDTCPQRRFNSGVKNHISMVLGVIANKHRVPAQIAEYSCAVCGCNLGLLIPAAPEDLHKDTAEEAKKRPKSCWIKSA